MAACEGESLEALYFTVRRLVATAASSRGWLSLYHQIPLRSSVPSCHAKYALSALRGGWSRTTIYALYLYRSSVPSCQTNNKILKITTASQYGADGAGVEPAGKM